MDMYSRLRINSAGKVYCRPDWKWDTGLSRWDDFDLWTMLDGKGFMRTDGCEFNLSPSDCFLLRDEERYVSKTDPNTPIAVIYIHFNFIDKKGKAFRPAEEELPPLHRKMDNLPFFAQLLERVLHSYLRKEQTEAAFWLSAAFHEIAAVDSRKNFLQEDNKMSLIVKKYFDEITGNPAGDYSIEGIAAKHGCSRDYFSRLFKRYAGTSFRDFCMNARIENAKLHLSSTDYPIWKIAEILGYHETGFFCRQFKDWTGLSPLKYRRRNLVR